MKWKHTLDSAEISDVYVCSGFTDLIVLERGILTDKHSTMK